MQGVYRYFYKKLIRPIFTIRSSPHSIALGLAFGLFIALTPTVGFQMILVVVIGTLIKANRIIALVVVWISNPLTFIPMYYGYYSLGGWILGVELWAFDNFSLKFNEFLTTGEDHGYSTMAREFGSEIFYPLWVGSLIIAIVAAIPTYPLTRYALRRAREKKQALWKEARARHAVRKRAAREIAERDEATPEATPESTAPPAKKKQTASGEGKLTVLLIAGLCAMVIAGCSHGSDTALDEGEPPGGPLNIRPADTMHIATLGLDSEHPLFVEFADFSNGQEHYAFLRIYNFSDRPHPLDDFKNSLKVEVGSDRCALRPVEDLHENDPSHTLRLLALASPGGVMEPGCWARIPLAYKGPALTLENAKIWSASEKGDTLLVLREVKIADWDRFVRNPTIETLSVLKETSRN